MAAKKTNAEARARLREIESDIAHGRWVDPRAGRVLFGDWLEECRATTVHLRPSSRARDDSYARAYLLPVFGTVPLRAIDNLAVRAWVADLSASGLAPATVAKALQILGKTFRAAVAARLVAVNPCEGVAPPKIEEEEARFLDPDELVALEDAMAPAYADLVPFLADAGLRIGEAAALRVRDVDPLRLTVAVREVLVEVPRRVSGAASGVVIGPPKTKAARRVVPMLTRDTADQIVARIDRLGLGAGDFLFAGPDGAPMRPNRFRARAWRPAVAAAGLADPQPTPHTLRHTAIAHWIAAGVVDSFKLATWAGHRSVSTIYRLYGHLLPVDASEHRDALSAMRAGARERLASRGDLHKLPANQGEKLG